MKPNHLILFIVLFFFSTSLLFAQQNAASQALVDQGVQLNDQSKFDEAIAKYKEALNIDPLNMRAEYEWSYTLFSTGKGKDAIPHLEKVIRTDNSFAAGGYDMLGSIYDDGGQSDKALELYLRGVKANPLYQRLHYNLGLFYLRQKKIVEAKASAIEALKLMPSHASSHKLYANIAMSLNEKAPAILALCNFLILEPQTARSAEAYNSLQGLLKQGISKNADGKGTNISLTQTSDKDMSALDLGLAMVVIAATTGDKAKLNPTDFLQEQLRSIFLTAGELSEKNHPKDFFWKFYADYFYTLAKTSNMPAFTRLISLSANSQENLTWFKNHITELNDFSAWVKSTRHNF